MTDSPARTYAERLAAASPLAAAALAFGDLIEPGARNAEIVQLGQQAGLLLVHGGDDFDPHFARPDETTTRCGQEVTRWLNGEQAARISVLCTACERAAKTPTPERTKGCAPKHAAHPDAVAAITVLAGMKAADLTDEHDLTEPSDTDLPVRGYAVEPRGHGLVAAYWLERGLARRRDDGWHGPALDAVRDRFTGAGWAVEPLRPSSLCVFAHRPQPTA